jgi:hypothetical protein
MTHTLESTLIKILEEVYCMVRKKPSVSSLIYFLLSSGFLLLVQFGFVSPVGLIIVTAVQYVVLFWLSIALFVSSLAILLAQYPHYAKWSITCNSEGCTPRRLAL